MNRSLAGPIEGAPERFVPDQMHGQLIEAEHLARYWWAAEAAAGKRVLDAGCGTGYGSAILAHAGAREVVGVDIAEDVLDAVRAEMPEAVELEAGDVRRLPFDAGSFDVVVSFEVLEHLDAPHLALDEFARVLTDDGLLIVSSPNRAVYPPGNPHHTHEFHPDELRGVLAERFGNVELVRQQAWLTSAILSDREFASDSVAPLETVELRKVAAAKPGSELYTLALAGNAPLPDLNGSAVITHVVEIRRQLEQLERASVERVELERELEGLRNAHEMLGRRIVAERASFADHVAELENLVEPLRVELDWRRDVMEQHDEEIAWRTEVMEKQEVALATIARSPSMRVTAPLRALAAGMRRFARR